MRRLSTLALFLAACVPVTSTETAVTFHDEVDLSGSFGRLGLSEGGVSVAVTAPDDLDGTSLVVRSLELDAAGDVLSEEALPWGDLQAYSERGVRRFPVSGRCGQVLWQEPDSERRIVLAASPSCAGEGEVHVDLLDLSALGSGPLVAGFEALPYRVLAQVKAPATRGRAPLGGFSLRLTARERRGTVLGSQEMFFSLPEVGESAWLEIPLPEGAELADHLAFEVIFAPTGDWPRLVLGHQVLRDDALTDGAASASR